MPRERNYNPVQAQRKAEKAKAIKKGKADVAAARNERLARKNPDRIRKQIEDLKAIIEGGGKLTAHEEQVLEGLEKEIKAVVKAREALGDRAPTFGHGGSSNTVHKRRAGFGKKRRRDDDESSDGSNVPEDVRTIPMPRDTPPPIPKKFLDEWYAKQRARRSANNEPLGEGRANVCGEDRSAAPNDRGTSSMTPRTAKPTKSVEAKTIYEAKPVIRDLQKEAVTAFIPTVVRRKIDKSHGTGGLLEPEEADRLEKEGYLKSSGPPHANSGELSRQPEEAYPGMARKPGLYHTTIEDANDSDEDER